MKAAVASEYKEAVILTALSRIILFFLGSLLRFHRLVQDMIVQTICNSGLGLVVLGVFHLFAIHPILPIALIVSLLVSVGYLLRVVSSWNNKLQERLVTVTEDKEEDRIPDLALSSLVSSPKDQSVDPLRLSLPRRPIVDLYTHSHATAITQVKRESVESEDDLTLAGIFQQLFERIDNIGDECSSGSVSDEEESLDMTRAEGQAMRNLDL
jgi:hypothetical protein